MYLAIRSLRLADPRTLDEAAANQIAEQQPAIVALGMSIHATEIAATQTAPELLHTLATSSDPEVLRQWCPCRYCVLLQHSLAAYERAVRPDRTSVEGGEGSPRRPVEVA